MQRNTQPYKATVLGVLLIVFGSLYFAHQAGAIDPRVWRVIFSWQMLLIAFGILSLAEQKYSWGVTLIVVGGLFMYRRYTGHGIDYLWPLLIILAGLAIIFVRPKTWKQENFVSGTVNGDTLNETAIFGGNERVVASDNFQGGSVVSIFGGSNLDLRQCKIVPGTQISIELTSIFGGSTLIVPEDWYIQVEATSILGGFSDKRLNRTTDTSKTVIVKGVSIFGGSELK